MELFYFAIVIWRKPFYTRFFFYVELGFTLAKAALALILIIMLLVSDPALEYVSIAVVAICLIGFTVGTIVHLVLWLIHYRQKYNRKRSAEEMKANSKKH